MSKKLGKKDEVLQRFINSPIEVKADRIVDIINGFDEDDEETNWNFIEEVIMKAVLKEEVYEEMEAFYSIDRPAIIAFGDKILNDIYTAYLETQ